MVLEVEGFARGAFVIRRGAARDYFELEHLHYVPTRPRTFTQVWVVEWLGARVVQEKTRHGLKARATECRRIAAVGVLSLPTLACRARESALGLASERRVSSRRA